MTRLSERYFPEELYSVLKVLDVKEGLFTKQILEVAGCSEGFLVNILQILKHKGFITVTRGTDRRKRVVNLTEDGRFLFELLEIYRNTLEGNIPLAKGVIKKIVKV